jgi:hypothetical protein
VLKVRAPLGESADTAGIGCFAGLHFATAMVNVSQPLGTQSLPVPVRLDLANDPTRTSGALSKPSEKLSNTVLLSELVHRDPVPRKPGRSGLISAPFLQVPLPGIDIPIPTNATELNVAQKFAADAVPEQTSSNPATAASRPKMVRSSAVRSPIFSRVSMMFPSNETPLLMLRLESERFA